MAIGMVGGIHIPRRAAHGHIDLVIYRTCPSQQRPVERTGGCIEGAGVDQQERTLPGGNHGSLGEANVVADGQADLAVLREINHGKLIAGREDIALLELDLAGDVDVEQMGLAMGTDQRARRGEN